ncbi:hypothetical protein AB0F17_15900 [Nonomuraea sp. NPDC026600]|uniref:hypothetical protein n=1 Tax=Nonomuraea sp. NPDC026600 TaxID=3155363 RepID=UPI0034105BA5
MAKIPPSNNRCTVYYWCSAAHLHPDGPHHTNLDLIEHLDHSHCLVELDVRIHGQDKAVVVKLTDLDRQDTTIALSAEQASVIGYIIRTFDRRGIREIAELLDEGSVLLNEEPTR